MRAPRAWVWLCALSVVVLPSTVATVGARPWATVELEEFSIPSEPVPGFLDIDGDLVVWVNRESGPSRIHAYDLSTATKLVISDGTGYALSPSVSANVVVWQEAQGRSANPDIYSYDLASQQKSPISTSALSQKISPDISGSVVVWVDNRAGSYDIYGYDLAAKNEFPVAANQATQDSPSISGSLVVWSDNRSGNFDVYLYDLSRNVEQALVTDSSFQRQPAIDGGVVVWSDQRNGEWDIYGYDLETGNEFPVAKAQGEQAQPAISGNIVVWQDKRNGNWDIYGYDLATKTEFPVTTNPADQTNPAISGNLVVWQDNRNGNWDIYGARITSAYVPPELDYRVSGGYFYTQANGQGGAGGLGFAVADESGIPFWATFQSLSLQTIGYPVSQRFNFQGFTTQAMQKLVLQHQPGVRGELVEPKGVFFLNTFDELHDAGLDPWLLAFRSIPPLEDTSPDSGLPWEQVVARHLAILDRDPALKQAYLAEPRWLEVFGLPMGYGDYPEMSVVRTQRAALQRWKTNTPWAKAGEVTIANGGDIAKEAGLWPAEATYPQPPP